MELNWTAPAPPSSDVSVAPAPVSLPPALDDAIDRTAELELVAWLEKKTGRCITLKLTNNRKSMMHMRTLAQGQVALRLHQRFLEAEDPVLEAVAAWITRPGDRSLWPVLDAFFKEAPPGPPSTRRVRIQPQGRHYHLQPLFEDLNARYFGGAITSPVTWAGNHVRRRRTICLGSWSPETNIIRIHPNLDDPQVPLYFLRFVLYHEMLHAHLGIGTYASGRRAVHPKAFREAERAYPDFERAEAWIKEPKNLRRVMRKKAEGA